MSQISHVIVAFVARAGGGYTGRHILYTRVIPMLTFLQTIVGMVLSRYGFIA